MKKIFMILAVAAAMVACGSKAENQEAQEEPQATECTQTEAVAEEDKTVEQVAQEAAEEVAKEAMRQAGNKLPIATKFVKKEAEVAVENNEKDGAEE